MSNISYNPFLFLYENEPPFAPFAKIIRSSFTQKVSDTFCVLHGNSDFLSYMDNSSYKKKYIVELGILDYLIVFSISRALMFTCLSILKMLWNNTPAIIFVWPAVIFGAVVASTFILDIMLRALVSIILTAAVAPIIVITHAITEINRYFIDQKIETCVQSELKNQGKPEGISLGSTKISQGNNTLKFYSNVNYETYHKNFVMIKTIRSKNRDETKASGHSCFKIWSKQEATQDLADKNSLLHTLCGLNEADFYSTIASL